MKYLKVCFIFPFLISQLAAQTPTGLTESDLHLSVQTGHAGSVLALAFNGDGTKMVSGGADRQVIVWDLRNGKQVLSIDAQDEITSVSFHPTLAFIAFATQKREVKLYDIRSRTLVKSFSGVGRVAGFSPSGTQFIAGMERYEFPSFSYQGKSGAGATARALAFSADGSKVVYGDENSITVQNEGGNQLAEFDAEATAVAVSDDGSRVFGGGLKSRLSGFSLDGSDGKYSLTSYKGSAGYTSLAANDKLLAATLSDGGIQFFNPNNGTSVDYLVAFNGAATASAFSEDGTVLAVGNQFGEIYLWDAATRKLLFLLSGITRKINVMKFSDDGNHFFLGFEDGSFKYWDYRPNGKVLSNRLDKSLLRSSDRWHFVVNQPPYEMSEKEIKFIVSLEQRSNDASNPRPVAVVDYDVTWNLKTNALSSSQSRTKGLLKSENGSVSMPSYYRRSGEARTQRRIINNIWPTAYMVASGGIDGGDVVGFYLFLGGVYNLVTLYPRDHYYKQEKGPKVKVIDQDFDSRQRLAAHTISEDGSLAAAVVETFDYVRLWPTAYKWAYNLYRPGSKYIDNNRPDSYKFLLFDMKSGKKLTSINANNPVERFGVFKNKWAWFNDGEELHIIDAETGRTVSTWQSRHAATFSPDGSELIWIDSKNTLRASSPNGGNDLEIGSAGETAITALEFRNDGKVIAAAGADGLIQLFNAETRQKMVTMTSMGTEDFLYITPKNEYYVSKGALRGVGYEIQGEIYPFDQFDVMYNRPDKVMAALAQEDSSLSRYYYYAWKKRIEKLGLSEDRLNPELSDIPVLKVISDSRLRVSEELFRFSVEASDFKTPLSRLQVWVNTVPEFGTKGFTIEGNQPGISFTKELSLKLNPGVNVIDIRVDNAAGKSSLKQTIRVNYKPEKQPESKLFVLGIGSSKFKDEAQNLNFAAKDAGDLVSAMKAAGTFSSVSEKLILDEEVTRENILGAKSFLQEAGVNDVVMVFFAGHGMLDNKNSLYLSTYAVDFDNPQDGGTPYQELEGLLDGIPSRQKILFIDACHSGEFDADAEQAKSSEMTQKDGKVLQRGIVAKKTQKTAKAGYGKAFELSKLLFADLRESNGAVVISAAGGAEFAFEGGNFKNGVFTYSLINGMKNKKADLNKDGEIAASELAKFLSKEVSRLTQGKQTPTSRVENLQNDFRVY